MPEKRILLKNCGEIDPEAIRDYEDRDGFRALAKARAMSPQGVIEEIKASGLRGRGGAGFPCGIKWELASQSKGEARYLICNADEGEVGTFKDRYIIQNDPFSVIEGIALASFAINAHKAYLYLRQEYHYLLANLTHAMDQARAKGYLADLDIEIREGAGSYICGETDTTTATGDTDTAETTDIAGNTDTAETADEDTEDDGPDAETVTAATDDEGGAT